MKNVNSRSTYTLRKLSIGLVSVALAGALFVASQDQAKAAVSDSFEANHPEVHAQAPETAHNQAVAAEMNNLVNELREKNNLQPLTTNQQLEDAARLSAYDDAASGSLSHANDYNRLADVGYLSRQQANEYEATNIPTLSYGQQMAQANLHSGGSTESTSISPRQQAEDVINGWTADIKLPSRGHRTQMLSSHWNQVGSAQVQSQSGGWNNANHVQYYGTDALSGYNRPQANDPFIPLDSYPDYLNRMVDHYTRWGDTAALADIDYLKDEYRRNMAHFNLPIGGTSTTPTPQEPVIRTAEENRTEVIPYETVRQANPDLA